MINLAENFCRHVNSLFFFVLLFMNSHVISFEKAWHVSGRCVSHMIKHVDLKCSTFQYQTLPNYQVKLNFNWQWQLFIHQLVYKHALASHNNNRINLERKWYDIIFAFYIFSHKNICLHPKRGKRYRLI